MRQPIFGGGFIQGDKEGPADDANGYARAGFVTASINYRLTPDNHTGVNKRQTAISHAAEDLMNAVRFLKRNTGTYHVDISRVAIVGSSAGGVLALIDAVEPATLVDPLFAYDPGLTFNSSDAPVPLFHASPQDGATGATWTGNVEPTCASINGSGDSCTAVVAPKTTCTLGADNCHTVSMSLFAEWWPTIQPFLWERLTLGSVRP